MGARTKHSSFYVEIVHGIKTRHLKQEDMQLYKMSFVWWC